jgi:hypothetical protein
MTAEEESVAAIFRALEFRQYPQARRLSTYKHTHKSAVQPFLVCLEHALATSGFMQWHPQVVIKSRAQGGQVRFRIRFQGLDGDLYSLEPIPPLGGEFSIDGERYDFRNERELLLSQSSQSSMEDYLNGLANERNRLLYATVKGIPRVSNLQFSYFERQRDRVFRNLTLFLLVVQEKSRQLFVEQALDAFLEMLGRIAKKAPANDAAT